MVIKGRSRSNGKQLAAYLLQNKENDRADVLDIRGTARPDDLRRSLLEMSLTSELSKRGELGLYHAQVNPAIGEDGPMTPEDWLRAADILEQSLGLKGQKRAIVLHEKNGRVHGHVVWQRYDEDAGRFRSDSHNYKKHDQARALIEQELGHTRTPQKAEREPTHKERLTDLWQQHPEGADFVQAAEDAGYYVAQGNARRPFRVVTPDGQSLDLTRQLDGIKTKTVRERLQPIRADLWTEADALQLSKANRDRLAERIEQMPEPIEDTRDLSDSQDRAEAMMTHYKERVQQQAEILPQEVTNREPDSEIVPAELSSKITASQDAATAMLEAYRQRQADQQEQERKKKVQEAQQQAAEQTTQKYYNPVTGQEMTPEAYQRFQEFLERQKQREQDRSRNRLEY
ncbi:relaxase/mobilization nuclease domain-containing protein [Spirosoma pomorum]